MKKKIFAIVCLLFLIFYISFVFADDLSGSVVGPQYSFPDPDVGSIKIRFSEIHNITENFYSGNGFWYGDPIAARWSGRLALGYMSAYKATNETIYATRTREALAFLLSNQQANGFWADSGYETGIGGAAMVEGYKIFGDSEYFQSSRMAADAELTIPSGECGGELNYCGLMLWHLANQYEITGEGEYLSKAIDMAQHVINQQDKNVGNWPNDHSGEFSYHVIYLRGLVELVRIIPHDHPFEKTLIEATVRALNHTITMQHSSGNFYADPSKTALATVASGTHPRTAKVLHVFIKELGLTKIDDVMDGLTLYTMDLDLGATNEEEKIMLLYATGVMVESYGGVIIDLYFDPSMVTTTTVPGGEAPSPQPPGGETLTTTSTITTTTTTQPTETTTTTQKRYEETPATTEAPNIIENTIEATKKIFREQPVAVTLVLIVVVVIIITIIHKKQASTIRV